MEDECSMEDVITDQEYEELLKDYHELKDELAQATGQLQSLSIVQQERDLAVQRVHTLQDELDYQRMQLQRTEASEAESRVLQRRINSILAICAVSRDDLGPNEKLAMITGPEQKPYSASLHGGSPDVKLTSMGQWNKAIGGGDGNSNRINKSVKILEALGVVKREEVECPDGKTHFTVELNENLLQHPRFIKPDEPRPHNGGDKRCPSCGNFCKKRLSIKYECVKCGIDFDQDMTPIVVEAMDVQSTVEPVDVVPPEPPTPIRPSSPPLACRTCNNVRVDRWTYSKLLQKWECQDCGSQERGRAS